MILLGSSPFIPFWQLFSADPATQMTVVDGDFTEEYFPVLLTATRALKAGQWPLWNPDSNGGQPLLADPQTALFYAPTWWALSGIHGPNGESVVALERLIPLHLGLAAGFTYLLGRVLLASRLAAAVAAIVFTFSGFLTSYPIEQLPILRVAAWFPLQLALFWMALERSLLPWAALAGVAMGIGVLAGHPQTSFLEGVGLVTVGAAWLAQGWSEGRRSAGWRRLAGALALSALVALGVAAIQLVPTYEFLRVSNRSEVNFAFLAGGFTLWELPLDIVAPRILGGSPPYVGIFPLVLAAVGLALRRSRVHGVALTLALAGLVLSTGAHTFVYPALYNLVPVFDVFRGQERSIMLFSMGMALLAGSGAATLAGRMDREDLRRLRPITGAVGLALLLGVGFGIGLYWRSQDVPGADGGARWAEVTRWVAFLWAMITGSLLLLLLRSHWGAVQHVLPVLICAFIAVDLLAVGWHAHLDQRRADDVYPPSLLIDRALSDLGTSRAYDDWVLKGNHGEAYGLPTVTRTFPLHLERFEQATAQLKMEKLFDLLNVRYLATWQPPSPTRRAIAEQPSKDGPRFLYSRTNPGPAWMVAESQFAPTPGAALGMVGRDDFDPRALAIIEGVDERGTAPAGPGRVISYERNWNQITAVAEAPGGGYLVISELPYPSWEATLDGARVSLVAADYLLQAVWVPPGTHQLMLNFSMASVQWGALLSGVTWLGLIGFGLGSRFLGWRRRAGRELQAAYANNVA